MDGTGVSNSSPVYTKPLEISGSTVMQARAFIDGYHSSNQAKVIYDCVDSDKNGIMWSLYTGAFTKIPDFNKMKPVSSGNIFQFGLKKIAVPENNFALRFKSFIRIDKEGDYTFYLTSNDGSKLYIDDHLLVDNDGEHGTKEVSNQLQLKKGRHAIRVDYFQSGGSKALLVAYSSKEVIYRQIPASILFKSKD